MAQNSNIEWTDHTFNPWSGCTKVSPACEHCYAEVNYSVKMRGVKWGKYGNRIIASDSMWKQPLKWNRQAEAEGVRKRVFCASLADVFEGRSTMPDESVGPINEARIRLFNLIVATPHLDWLLLTKRPENVLLFLDWLSDIGTRSTLPDNVWIGTTVENQEWADKRIPELLKIPAKVRFLSAEPLLGPVDLQQHFGICHDCDALIDEHRYNGEFLSAYHYPPGIHLVIVGGESGPKARPMDITWAMSIIEQCKVAGVPVFMKQLGTNPIGFGQFEHENNEGYGIEIGGDSGNRLSDRKGGDMSEWPDNLRIREVPNV
jgi:protein gp37